MVSTEEIKRKFNSITVPNSISAEETITQLRDLLPLLQSFLDHKNDMTFEIKRTIEESETVLDANLPQSGQAIERIFELFQAEILPHFVYENVNFYGFIPRSPTHVSILAESLVPFFNQFLGSALSSPMATAVESLTIKWIGEILGYEGNYFGTYTIGGSDANLDCIETGLHNTLPWDTRTYGFFKNQRPIIYFTDQAHICISNSLQYLGLGTISHRIVPTNDDFTMDIDALEVQIKQDLEDNSVIPVMIITTAGTTNTGAIDDFKKIYEIAKQNNLWLHVDAAYGGFARLAQHPVAQKLQEIHLADSIAIDTHKWFFTPLGGGLGLVKDDRHLLEAFESHAEYLDPSEYEGKKLIRDFQLYGFPLSRKWHGFMVWMNFLFYGTEGIGKLITRNILLADYFRECIREHQQLQLYGETQLGIVCFRHSNQEVQDHIFNQVMTTGKHLIGTTRLQGVEVLRISILNEYTETEHLDELLTEIDSIIENYELLFPIK